MGDAFARAPYSPAGAGHHSRRRSLPVSRSKAGRRYRTTHARISELPGTAHTRHWSKPRYRSRDRVLAGRAGSDGRHSRARSSRGECVRRGACGERPPRPGDGCERRRRLEIGSGVSGIGRGGRSCDRSRGARAGRPDRHLSTGGLLADDACERARHAARGGRVRGLARGRARAVVTFAGGGATSPQPRYDAYATSKAAVVRLTENLGLELSERGVRVNAVSPGFIATDIHAATLEGGSAAARRARRGTPARRRNRRRS